MGKTKVVDGGKKDGAATPRDWADLAVAAHEAKLFTAEQVAQLMRVAHRKGVDDTLHRWRTAIALPAPCAVSADAEGRMRCVVHGHPAPCPFTRPVAARAGDDR